ncbi:MAG: DUF2809 domain-containing protein [Sphingomonadales bacterium]|nr:MAG: DUF2809 domain-containing protein [Sphingomonadales bacterium]
MILRSGYAIVALAIFLVEVGIALFVRDAFIRPYFGDTLAVVLVYCGLRAVLPLGVVPAAGIALAIAFGVEFGQYFGMVDRLGLGGVQAARIVLGTGFSWLDLIAYTAGALAVLAFEAVRRPQEINRSGS